MHFSNSQNKEAKSSAPAWGSRILLRKTRRILCRKLSVQIRHRQQSYSQAIEVNGMLYTSGVIPVDPATGNIAEGVEAQAEQAFKNLCNLVEESGSKVENIIKTTVFIKEMNDFGTINEIYKKYFKEPFPARSCVEVARLPKDVLLEVEAIAFK